MELTPPILLLQHIGKHIGRRPSFTKSGHSSVQQLCLSLHAQDTLSAMGIVHDPIICYPTWRRVRCIFSV